MLSPRHCRRDFNQPAYRRPYGNFGSPDAGQQAGIRSFPGFRYASFGLQAIRIRGLVFIQPLRSTTGKQFEDLFADDVNAVILFVDCKDFNFVLRIQALVKDIGVQELVMQAFFKGLLW